MHQQVLILTSGFVRRLNRSARQIGGIIVKATASVASGLAARSSEIATAQNAQRPSGILRVKHVNSSVEVTSIVPPCALAISDAM